MTSTVLDVTVLLLCVSASVVTLGAVADGSAPGEPRYTADDAADRLTTETTTVTYPIDGTDHDTRTFHGTLAELLTAAARTDLATNERFRSRALAAVDDALAPRTRVDLRRGAGDANNGRPDVTELDVGDRPVSDGAVGIDDVLGLDPAKPIGSGEDSSVRTVSIGGTPPRGATVTAAEITHPVPNGSKRGEADHVRIVVRVW